MKRLKLVPPILLSFLSLQPSLKAEPQTQYSVQVFGDFFWPADGDRKFSVSLSDAIEELVPSLKKADLNVINFEGVATEAFMPYVLKSHLLRMAPTVGTFLAEHNIKLATLANNHSLDFGRQGLFDSLANLQGAGISTTGAGMNLDGARRPAIAKIGDRNFCVIAFNRTLPYEFYATATKPGTNSVRFFEIAEQIAAAKRSCDFVLTTFHWGWELSRTVQNYQQKLAKAAIDAGADAVVGHHPHVVQEHTIYQGKPIFFSVGNFVFGTLPRYSKPEGMGVNFILNENLHLVSYEVIPLVVDNNLNHFKTRLAQSNHEDKVSGILKTGTRCKLKDEETRVQSCVIAETLN